MALVCGASKSLIKRSWKASFAATELPSQRPDLNRPDLNRPDLNRPDLNRIGMAAAPATRWSCVTPESA
jgi:hypothetical protein